MNIGRVGMIAGLLLLPLGAVAEEPGDLRQFRIGMPVSALPDSGYAGFACRADPTKTLSDWGDYQSCPAAPDGTRAVSFRYDNRGSPMGGEEDKTEVGGQPVNIALVIDDKAQVAAIHIETDPHVRLHEHKKAFLFALQVRARFGEDGWTCNTQPPTPTEQPVGGVFVHEHCEKLTASRHFLLDRQLFRDPAKDLREFTDATQLTILHGG